MTTPGRDDSVLAKEHANEVMNLRNEVQSKIGHDIKDPDVWFGSHLCSYLTCLCLDAVMGDNPRLARKSEQLRRDSLVAFESYLKRPPVPEDVIKVLSQHATVPAYLPEALQKDFERLRS